MELKEVAAKYEAYLIEQRRWFHQHPEYSEQEFESCKHIRAELDKMGVEWRPCGLETGTLATIQGGKPGKTMLLRADMDALRIQEETGLEYASVNDGLSHACGHDCHMAMLLTTVQVLKDMKEELCGTVRFAFQPSEEIGTGGKSMVAGGAMDGVDGCFGVHVWADVPSGKVSVEAGPRMAACDMFKIYVTGKSCHGAQPHQGIDPVVVCSQLVNALQVIVSREIDPNQPAVVTVGQISAGTSWNIVPEGGFLQGTTRCFDTGVRKQLEDAVKRMVKSVGETYRAEIQVEWTPIVAPVVNTPEMSALASEAAKKVLGPDSLYLYEKTNGGEDMSCYMEKATGALAFLGVGCEACGAIWPQHNSKFQVDESALIGGVKLCAQVVMDFNAQ